MADNLTQPAPFDFSLFTRVRDAATRVLMLDYDGTLAPFREQRMEARPYPGVLASLRGLIGAGHTRVMIVSGRPVSEVVQLLGEPLAVEIWGAHGWERRHENGEMEVWTASADVSSVLGHAVTRITPLLPAGSLEVKRGAVVAHTRAVSSEERTRIAANVRAVWAPRAHRDDIELREFDGGFELRAVARTKGTVVRSVQEEFGRDSLVAYLGDDLTDEDAFAEIRQSNWPILVRESPRPSNARYWMPPPEELLKFFKFWTRYGE